MKQFEFKGDWEFEYQFDAFKGFQSSRGSYAAMNPNKKSDGTVRVIIKDELNDDTDPSKEQIAAIDYISDNPDKIKHAILKAVEELYPKMKETYGYDKDDEDDREFFPEIKSLEEYSKVFGVGNVFIHIPHKENTAYIGLECGCSWDEEHGLGMLLHNDRLIEIGAADEAFTEWKAYKDNGTYEQIKNQKRTSSIPKKYKPHPKYNKLKPTQKSANNNFEYSLISQGYNKEFKELVEKGDIDINGKNKGRINTFFEQACANNNIDLVIFMLDRGADIGNGLHRCINGDRFNKEIFEYLLNNGCSINKQNSEGNTILNSRCQELAYLYDVKKQQIQYGWKGVEKQDELIIKKKDFISKLIEQESNPEIKNNYGFNCFSMARNLPDNYKKEMNEFIKKCVDKFNEK